MLPVPIKSTQTVPVGGKIIPEIPIINQTISPDKGVAKKLLFVNSILCSSSVF